MCFLYFCSNVYIRDSVHSSFSLVADRPVWADLRLWDLAAAIRTLLCARYCMQGHHLAAASSG